MKLTEKQKTQKPGMARPKCRRGERRIIFKVDHLGSWKKEELLIRGSLEAFQRAVLTEW